MIDLIPMGAKQQLNFANRSLSRLHHSLILPGEDLSLFSASAVEHNVLEANLNPVVHVPCFLWRFFFYMPVE